MNNYTHAYSDYVNHILNKSPSKNAYSFARAERFPQKHSEFDYLELDNASQITYQQDRYTPEKREKSPIRNKDTDRSYGGKIKEEFNQVSIRRNVEEVLNKSSNKRVNTDNKSKSPIRSQYPLPQQSTSQAVHQKPNRLTK
jgi:hypothetical protein